MTQLVTTASGTPKTVQYHPVVQEMLMVARSLDLPPDYIAMTAISGAGRSSFLQSNGLPDVGWTCYVVVQTTRDGRVLGRTYISSVEPETAELVIGGGVNNTTAYWLNDPARMPDIEPKNVQLATAFLRCMQALATVETASEPDEVRLPEAFALYRNSDVALPVPSAALTTVCRYLRAHHSVDVLKTPHGGQVVSIEPAGPLPILAPGVVDKFVTVTLQDTSRPVGTVHAVLVPRCHGVTLCVQEGQSVAPGTALALLTAQTPDDVVQHIAWWSVLAKSPRVAHGETALPLDFTGALHARGTKPCRYIEDVADLLTVSVANPAHRVRGALNNGALTTQCDPRTLATMMKQFRTALGNDSVYASDYDVCLALDHPTEPLQLSGLASVQVWSAITTRQFRRTGVFANFGSLKRSWENTFGSTDPRSMPAPPNVELQVLESALYLATKAAHPAELPRPDAPLLAVTKALDEFTHVGTLAILSDRAKQMAQQASDVVVGATNGMNMLLQYRDHLVAQKQALAAGVENASSRAADHTGVGA